MVQELFDKNILVYVMAGLCGLGVLIKLVLSVVYSRLIKASDQMGTSRNKLMKSMCTKFETSYNLNMGVHNVDSFVDKYVYKHRFCGILLYTWENFCGQLLLLCMMIGSVGAVLGLLQECGKHTVLFTFLVGITTSALLVIVDNMMNLSTKKNVIRVNIQDYLENFLQARMNTSELKAAEAAVETGEQMAVPEQVQRSEKLENEVQNMYELNKKEEKIIEDILKEYII